MIRFTVTTDDGSMAGNLGGNVLTTHKSFDIEAPELEAYIKAVSRDEPYKHRQLTGWEVVISTKGSNDHE